jgi:hypothetical protein
MPTRSQKIHLRNFDFQNFNFHNQKIVGLGSDRSEKFASKTLALHSTQGHPFTEPEKTRQDPSILLIDFD